MGRFEESRTRTRHGAESGAGLRGPMCSGTRMRSTARTSNSRRRRDVGSVRGIASVIRAARRFSGSLLRSRCVAAVEEPKQRSSPGVLCRYWIWERNFGGRVPIAGRKHWRVRWAHIVQGHDLKIRRSLAARIRYNRGCARRTLLSRVECLHTGSCRTTVIASHEVRTRVVHVRSGLVAQQERHVVRTIRHLRVLARLYPRHLD